MTLITAVFAAKKSIPTVCNFVQRPRVNDRTSDKQNTVTINSQEHNASLRVLALLAEALPVQFVITVYDFPMAAIAHYKIAK